MLRMWLSVSVVALFLVCAPAWAEDPAAPAGDEALYEGDGGGALEPAAQEAVIDVLEDGALEGDPAAAGPNRERLKKFQELKAQADKDGDGKLSEEERKAARGQMRETRKKMVRDHLSEKADQNGDGALDDAEKAALEEQVKQHEAKMADLRAKVEKQFDANADGQIDPAERAKLREAFMKRAMKHRRDDGKGPGRRPGRREGKGDGKEEGGGEGEKPDEGDKSGEGEGDK